jgi:hypothetical protein
MSYSSTSLVRDVINNDVPQAVYARAGGFVPSLPQKPWTDQYRSIAYHICYPPTVDSLDTIFTPEDEDDLIRLGSQCYDINELVDVLPTEGDSVGSFRVQATQAIRLAFKDLPLVLERSECEPPGNTSFSKRIDHCFSFMHANTKRCIAAGEVKTYGIIEADVWRRTKTATSMQRRLGKELRA